MISYKQLDKKKKVEHIWYYYKWFIIIGIGTVFLFTFLTMDFINKPDYVFNTAVLAGTVDYDSLSLLEQDLTKELIGEDRGKKEASFDIYQLTTKNGVLELDYNQLQKFFVKLSAKEIDVMILPEGIYNQYKDRGMFIDLTQLEGFDKEKYNMLNPYMISLKNSDNINKVFKTSTELFMGIPVTTENKEMAIKGLKYLYNK